MKRNLGMRGRLWVSIVFLAAAVGAPRGGNAASSAGQVAVFDADGSAQETIQRAFAEFDRAAAQGVRALIALRKADDPVAAERFKRMEVVDSGDPRCPLELQFDGKRVALIKEWLGEGHNARAFLSDHGTVIKVTKLASSARSLLMAAWAAPILEEKGIRTAKIYRVEPTGLFMEQEYLPGPSLKKKFDEEWGDSPPLEIRDQVFRALKINQELAESRGITLNLKADAFQLGPDGRIILVDLSPSDTRLEQYDALFKGRRALGEKKFWSELMAFFSQGTKHAEPANLSAIERSHNP